MPEIIVKIGANSSGFAAVLDHTKAKLGKFAKDIGTSMFGQYVGAQGFVNVLGKISNFLSDIIKKGDDIQDVAELFGGDTNFVQRLQQDAEDAGVSFEKLQASMGKLAEAREKAMGGDLETRLAFAEFGLALRDIEAGNPAELFRQIREQVAALGDEAASSAKLLTTLATLGFTSRQLPLLRTPEGNQPVLSPEELNTLSNGEAMKNKVIRDAKLSASKAAIGAGVLLSKLGFGKKTLDSKALGIAAGGPATLGLGLFAPKPAEQPFDGSALPLPENKTKSAAKRREDAINEALDAEVDALLAEADAKAGAKDQGGRASARFTPPGNLALDSLARFGGYVGNATGMPTMERIQSDQLRAQVAMERHLQVIANRIARAWGFPIQPNDNWD